MPEQPPALRPRDRTTILQALRAGVVPRAGLQHIQVGRAREVQEVIGDIDKIQEGGTAIRFVIGDYGAGKTFFLSLSRAMALQQRLIVMHADLTPDRRLQGSHGQARLLYADLIHSMASRSRPEGQALTVVLDRFLAEAEDTAQAQDRPVESIIQQRLGTAQEAVLGIDFVKVITCYHVAGQTDDGETQAAALQWLRGEMTSKTDARQWLGVRTVIDDAAFYDALRLWSHFMVAAGYAGLLVVLDEMVNVFKLISPQARAGNYEQILRITNDALQGSAHHLGVYFGGTPEFLTDGRRGMYSYEALRSRLSENAYAKPGRTDLSGPVLRLQSLTPEELYVLLTNLRRIQAHDRPPEHLLPDAGIAAFLAHCQDRLGADYFRTPRTSIRSFLDLLAILEQYPQTPWSDILGTLPVIPEALPQEGLDDNLTLLRL